MSYTNLATAVLDKIRQRYGIEVKEVTLNNFFRGGESRLVLSDGRAFTTNEVMDTAQAMKWVRGIVKALSRKPKPASAYHVRG